MSHSVFIRNKNNITRYGPNRPAAAIGEGDFWYGLFWQPQRLLWPQNSLRGQIWPQIWNQWPQLPTYPCAYCLYGMDPFDSLGGHYGLQTASEVRSDLRFEISDLNYLHIHVHIAYMVWTLLTASEATTASKQPRSTKLRKQQKWRFSSAVKWPILSKNPLIFGHFVAFDTLAAPPGGRFGRHLVAR